MRTRTHLRSTLRTPALLVFLSVTALAPPALARTVAVLRFGGVHGTGARARIARALRGRNTILDETAVPDACTDLGIPMSKGPNLARCAKKAGATAVIGGATKARSLTLVIFSGKTGRVVAKGRVRWSAFPSSKMVRRAMRLVRRGLAKTPRSRRRRPAPTPKPDPPDEPGADGGLTFEPDEVTGSKGGETNGGGALGGDNKGTGEDPDASGGLPSLPDEDPLAAKDSKKATPSKTQDEANKKKTDAKPNDPRLYGTAGLGIWIRSFSVNQPADPAWNKSYGSGAAFALALESAGRPLAYFLDGFAANIFARLRFATTLGLKSGVAGSGTSGLSTSFYEFIFDVGYLWNIFDKADSPRVEFNLGYGILSFGVDWGNTPLGHQVPGAAYGFMPIGVGGSYPFLLGELGLSAMLRFDYRIVFDAGGITAEEDPGFGPGSVGGIALSLGLKGNYGDILFGITYTYTRFFFAFTDAQNRATTKKPSAGGALDQYHAFIVNGGYGF